MDANYRDPADAVGALPFWPARRPPNVFDLRGPASPVAAIPVLRNVAAIRAEDAVDRGGHRGKPRRFRAVCAVRFQMAFWGADHPDSDTENRDTSRPRQIPPQARPDAASFGKRRARPGGFA